MADADDAPGAGAAASEKRARLSEEERKAHGKAANDRRRQRERARKRGEEGAPLLVKRGLSVDEQKRKACERTKAWRLANLERDREAKRKYHRENAAKICARSREWYAANKERANTAKRARHHADKERNNEISKSWRKANPERSRAAITKWHVEHPDYDKIRRRTDPNYRLVCILRSRLSCALMRAKAKKPGATLSLIGCTLAELRGHIEGLFLPGMAWENHGPVWHLDHKRPLCTFDLSDQDQLRLACHYTNLQPLWAEQNLAKPRANWKPEGTDRCPELLRDGSPE